MKMQYSFKQIYWNENWHSNPTVFVTLNLIGRLQNFYNIKSMFDAVGETAHAFFTSKYAN